jgi:ABC-type polysaccharide/polyol phosphate export permease/tetratricopeptide (TPR) repeat protein
VSDASDFPATPDAAVAAADALNARGARADALAMLEEAMRRWPEERTVADRLIMLHSADQRPDRALEVAWGDLQRNGGDSARWGRVAQLASQAGEADRALQAARSAVAAGGESATDWSLLAALAFRHHRFEESERAAREAVARDPGHRSTRRLLASILTRLDRSEDLVEELRNAVVLEPGDAALRHELASACAVSGRLVDARQEGRAALELDPANIDYALFQSGVCAQLGHAEEAIELLRGVVERSPEDGRAHYSLAHLLWGRGEQDAAIFHAAQASSLNPVDLGYRDFYVALLEQRTAAPPAAFGNTARAGRSLFESLREPDGGLPGASVGGLRRWARVVFALMLRDMRTRHAGTRLGFLWAIAEPLLHLSVLAVVFSIFNRGHPPLGEDWFFFYATGVIPFLMWSHVTSNGFHGLVANVLVLQIPAISRLDVLLASALVDLVIGVAIGVVMFWAFWLLEKGPLPRDPLAAVEAIAVLWLFAFGLSVVNATVETVNGTWLKIWPSIIRLQYFTAGIFYVPQEMPYWLREVLVLNPLLLCLEWFRTAFFDQYAPPWLDRQYAVIVTLAVVMLGFVLEAGLRRRWVRR